MLAAKRLASVVPEVDLGECTLHSPLQKANKAEPTLALKPRGDVTRNPKQGCQWHQNRTCVCVRQKYLKQKQKQKKPVIFKKTFTVVCVVCEYGHGVPPEVADELH